MHSTRTSRLPSTYERDEIKAIESHVDRSGPIGKRTYAMLLLSTRLGLRISDIIGLTFDDLDWDRSMLNIIQAKTGRTVELPLLKDVGEAIVSYLKVRPKTSSPNIFVTHVLPYTPMNRSGAARHISNVIVGSNIHTAGRKHGPHSMRFSLATRLLQQGTGLVCISETLGHSGTDVTMNYLRIDINSLTRCMHDVPQVDDNFTINQTVDFMNENRKYTSVFAPYLERFVAMKDAGGLSPRSGLYDALRLFDRFATQESIPNVELRAETIAHWVEKTMSGNKPATIYEKISAIGQFCKYLIRLGIKCEVPAYPRKPKKDVYAIYLFQGGNTEDFSSSRRLTPRFVALSFSNIFSPGSSSASLLDRYENRRGVQPEEFRC